MRAQRSRWTAVRAVVAVAALYALALQAILGGLIPSGAVGEVGHRLCLQGADIGDEGPVKRPAAHDHLSCCTAAHVQPAFLVPQAEATGVAWPSHRAVRVTWRPEVVALPRAPPNPAAAARAPPVA